MNSRSGLLKFESQDPFTRNIPRINLGWTKITSVALLSTPIEQNICRCASSKTKRNGTLDLPPDWRAGANQRYLQLVERRRWISCGHTDIVTEVLPR
jgi:hypothetical protein